MKIEYDPSHDVLNIEFLTGVPITESVEIEGMVVDYAEDRRIVSLEILDAGKRTTKGPLEAIDVSILKEKVA